MGIIKPVLFLAGIFGVGLLCAQNLPFGYLVEFTDKANTSFSIDHPEEFLSNRAIARRNKYAIAINEDDFPVNPEYIDSLRHFDAQYHVSSRWFNSAVFFTPTVEFVSQALSCSFVKNVTLVYKQLPLKSGVQTSKWAESPLQDIYGSSWNQISMCNAQKLHQQGYRGKGIHIAVLDGGFYKVNELPCFDSLNQSGRLLSHWDFVAHNDNVFDDHTHGMGVLSIMGGIMPGELMGTAPEASYHLYLTEDVYTEFLIEEENWIAGAERADSAGADIITASLGYSVYDDETMNHSYADMDGKSTRITRGAEIAFSKGMFIVNSAGNEGGSAWKHITAPSDGAHVLCIGAVDSVETIASFSSLGPSFDGRVKPDVVAKGLQATLIKADGTVGTGNGTSYSCPVMAGMVACLWQALPHYSNQELLELIRSNGDRYHNPDNTYGFGIPDFGKAGFIIDSANYPKKGNDNLVKAYPNPFTDEVQLQFYSQKKQEVRIALFDARGTLLHSQTRQLEAESYNHLKIDALYSLERGYYFLSVYSADGMISKKIMRF